MSLTIVKNQNVFLYNVMTTNPYANGYLMQFKFSISLS